MNRERRHFLGSAGALAALAACGPGKPGVDPLPSLTAAPDRPPEPAPLQPAEALDAAAFAWGVQVGDATLDGALVGVRTTEATIELVLYRAGGEAWEEVDRLPGLVVEDGTVRVELVGLDPDTGYTVLFLAGDRRSATARFRTAVPVDGHRKIVFAATSCFGSTNPAWGNLAVVAAAVPDFALLLGDTVYADGSLTLEDYREDWKAAQVQPSLQALFAATSVVAIWDDHEVANNWVFSAGDLLHDSVTPAQVETATLAMREALPMRTGPGGTGLWRKLSWGVVDLFVLDCRGERDDDRIVSDEQLTWIEDELAASAAMFKIVLASVHVTDHEELLSSGAADDRWQGYPTQRAALVAALAATPGVFVVTGDMHYGATQRIDPPDGVGADLWEIAVGPAGSTIFPLTDVAAIGGGAMPAQYDLVIEDWTSCVFVADPGLRTLTVTFLGDDGASRGERTWTVA